MTPRSTPRTRVDACPGALQLHEAADGTLARVRLPGGRMTSEQLTVLADASTELSNGELVLTSRGNVQLRAVKDPDALAQRLAAAGLLPSETHERVRNVLASPLSGRIGGAADVRGLVTDLDDRLCADPDLAELPGRILFTVDDGRGDVSRMAGDIGVHALGDGSRFALVLAGRDTGVRLGHHEAVEAMLDAARAFRDERGGHWRIDELPDGVEKILSRLQRVGGDSEELWPEVEEDPPIGWFVQDDGLVALGAALAHAIVPARTATFLAAIGRPVYVTPWRSVLIVDLDEGPAETVVRVLAPMGLIFDAESPWARVSSCVGSPGCAKSHADVRADLDAAVAAGEVGPDAREHWVGCERRCGRPRGEVVDVVASDDGYRRE